jgi:hypothetical protein
MGYLPPSVPDSYLQLFRIEPSILLSNRRVGQVEALHFQPIRPRLTAETVYRKGRAKKRKGHRRNTLPREWKRNGYIWLEKGQYIDEYC